jgi:hypothetical protein
MAYENETRDHRGARSPDGWRLQGRPRGDGGDREAVTNVVPTGTELVVELDRTIGTEVSRVGDRFTATVRDAVVSYSGVVLIPRGAIVEGVITGLDDSDHIGEPAAIRINLDYIRFQGRRYIFSADVIRADVELERRAGVEDIARNAAIGAAAGAVLGAIVGGDLKDILMGGALGAGVGTIIALGVGDVEAALPRGTDLTLRTTRQILLR